MTNYTISAAHGSYAMTGHVPFLDKKLNDIPKYEEKRAQTQGAVAFSPINEAEKGLTNAQVTQAVRWHRDWRW